MKILPIPYTGNRFVFWGLFALFLLVSGAFDDKRENPFAVPASMEAGIAFVLLFTVVYVFSRAARTGRMPRLDLFVLVLVLLSWVLSAVLALLAYGQPLIFGLAEDRRILNLLAYFPVAWAFRNGHLDAPAFYRLVLVTGGAAIVLSFLAVQFGQQSYVGGNNLLARENRYAIGQHFVVLTALLTYVLAWTRYRARLWTWLGWFLAAAATIVLVMQTRTIMLLVLAVMLLFAVRRRSFWVTVPVAGMVMIVVVLALGDAFVSSAFGMKFAALWGQYFSEEYLSRSARAAVLRDIIDALAAGAYVKGYGALSLMWENGFHRIYGEYFFLADVGLAGMFFRYGVVITALLLLLSFHVIRLAWRDVPPGLPRHLFFLGVAYVLLSPGAGLFLYAGLPLGLMLALSALAPRGQVAGSKERAA